MKKQNQLFEPNSTSAVSPMMQQYFNIKAEYSDCLLLFRLGDFYELFFEDAVVAAPILGIVLTKRGKTNNNELIPMCGVPFHSADIYFTKLIKSGYKLAVCEQMETPIEAKKRGNKSVVRREVTKIITNGTLIQESMLTNEYSQYLMSIHIHNNRIYIAYADIATGKLFISEFAKTDLTNELARIQPSEIILSDHLYVLAGLKEYLKPYKSKLTIRANSLFTIPRLSEKIKEFYGIISLKSLTELDENQIITVGSLLEYVSYTHKALLPRIEKPEKIISNHYLEIDSSTRKNLELNISISQDQKKSLLGLLDNCLTSMGKRLLQNYLIYPLIDHNVINARFDTVEFFKFNQDVTNDIKNLLSKVCDQERTLNKIFTRIAHFQDIINLVNSLVNSFKVADILRSQINLPINLKIAISHIGNFSDLLEYLTNILPTDIQNAITTDQYIKPGFDYKLDDLRNLQLNSQQLIINLRNQYRNNIGIQNLKINFNNMLGYYIEVPFSQLNKIKSEEFILRQSLVNGSRFTTKELQELEFKLLRCQHDIKIIENEIFENMCVKIVNCADDIALNAQAIANIDVACNFAYLAIKNNYIRPIIDDSYDFIIHKGRHPVVERNMRDGFIANSCDMSDSNFWLITGPNMAGKSTFLRQNAIIIIMAQIGCFIPVEYAKIGMVDKLFSRIGASDDISLGHSTFMVEMIETANILNNSTERSFLILDEIGRGTSSQDGLVIAQAVIEDIHNNIKARTLFATHYHDLTDLESSLEKVGCYTMKVKEHDDKIAFIHEIICGKADKSYGLHVAEIAGISKNVIARANQLLSQNVEVANNDVIEFNHIDYRSDKYLQFYESLCKININNLTPKMAFDLIYNLKGEN